MTQDTATERPFTGKDITTDFVLDLAETADQCELDHGDPVGETLRLLVSERDALQAKLDAARKVKPLKIATQYADPIIETDFGDYFMKPNVRYTPKGTEFLGRHIEQRKYHIFLNGMLVLHTNDPDKFLEYVQADFERRILRTLNQGGAE